MFRHVLVATDLEGAAPGRFARVMELARAERARMTMLLTIVTSPQSHPRSSLTTLGRAERLRAALCEEASGIDFHVRYGFARDGAGLAFAVARNLGCDLVVMGLSHGSIAVPDRQTLYVPATQDTGA
ncbi:Universal stress protein family protein [Luteibacter sp. UNCMF331Sha3.1]|uniref:universal stress protein n=1 Tax=Luteibacter sp. UNCMF331Sha3.1 TaxID=1502760 RepID=UPI0008D0906A|nr:universal stress protein [Luteibacter sp. UNCMF331Sha3.1]SEN19244.1 Universal stress protein family protein [Luteibacter sp. UNCMF331Sha3.1]